MSSFLKGYCASLIDPQFVPTALKVALIVGSILFVINHGSAVLSGKMSRDRWISGAITYIVPYLVNIHGQFISRYRDEK
ncbi:hypothetical protein NIES4074_50290 [Cylindrospermum sp. NIES-4074]|nr:hypothetical protein NIES4074_50290 [Cylindrospermum sp. NIES-4074]